MGLGGAQARLGRRALRAALIAVAVLAAEPAAATALPRCAGDLAAPRILAQTHDLLEFGLFDDRGRFLYSDQGRGAVMRIDRFGRPAKVLTPMKAPGAMVRQPDGSVLVGFGDTSSFGVLGDLLPQAQLWRIDPGSGSHVVVATGLGMANGIARAADGTVYATNDLGFGLDRIRNGRVDHSWASLFSANGVVVSPDERYLYVSQTFTPPTIARISLADPRAITTYAAPRDPADLAAGLDDIAIDDAGNLYAAANAGGAIWRISPDRAACTLATGLSMPSAVTIGPNGRDLYFVTFGGQIGVLDGVVPVIAKRARAHHHRRKHVHRS